MIYSKLNFRFPLLVCFIAFSPGWATAQCEVVFDVFNTPACDGSVTVQWTPNGPAESYTVDVLDPMDMNEVIYTETVFTTMINITAEVLSPGFSYPITITSNCEINNPVANSTIDTDDIFDANPVISISDIVYPTCKDVADGSFDVTVLDNCGGTYNITLGDETFFGVPAGQAVTFTGLEGSSEGTTHAVEIEVSEPIDCSFNTLPPRMVTYILFFC